MDPQQVTRVLRALDAAIAILRAAEGRRTAADIRVQSILAASRAMLSDPARTKMTAARSPESGDPFGMREGGAADHSPQR
jgi:hypothetical protein